MKNFDENVETGYIALNGRVWSSEEVYLEFKQNIRKNLWSAVSLEHYANHTGDNEIFSEEAFVLLKEYRKNHANMSEEDLLELTALIAEKFKELYDKVGREKFIFSDDGDITYIKDKSL